MSSHSSDDSVGSDALQKQISQRAAQVNDELQSKGDMVQALQKLKQVAVPTTLSRGSQIAIESSPGAFHAQPRRREPETTHTMDVTQTDEAAVPPADFAVQGELVAASPVIEEVQQPRQEVATNSITEVYKAEPLERPENRYRLTAPMKWSIIFIALATLSVVAAVLLRRSPGETPFEQAIVTSNKSHAGNGLHNELSNFTKITQHMVFLGTIFPSCSVGDVSITLRCEAEDAVLFVDPNKDISHNMEPWEMLGDQMLRCTQQKDKAFSYVSFSCAWPSYVDIPNVSVEIDDVDVDCPYESLEFVSTGIKLGRLCRDQHNGVAYESTATSCPVDLVGDGCVAKQICSDCFMPSWSLVEAVSLNGTCITNPLNGTMAPDFETYPQVFDNVEELIEENQGFYNITSEGDW